MTETTHTSTTGREYDAQFTDFTLAMLQAALTTAFGTYNDRCKHWDACSAAYDTAVNARHAIAQLENMPAWTAANAAVLEARAAMHHARALVTEQGKIIAALNRAINARHADV